MTSGAINIGCDGIPIHGDNFYKTEDSAIVSCLACAKDSDQPTLHFGTLIDVHFRGETLNDNRLARSATFVFEHATLLVSHLPDRRLSGRWSLDQTLDKCDFCFKPASPAVSSSEDSVKQPH